MAAVELISLQPALTLSSRPPTSHPTPAPRAGLPGFGLGSIMGRHTHRSTHVDTSPRPDNHHRALNGWSSWTKAFQGFQGGGGGWMERIFGGGGGGGKLAIFP